MGVAGDLGDFDLVGILPLLGNNRATGRLRVTAGGDDVTLHLKLGQLDGVTSTRVPLRLGRVLAQRGLASELQIQEALRIQEAEGGARSLGEILVVRGWATEHQVAACVHDQCVLALSRALAAESGTFAYESGGQAPLRGPSLPLNAQTALLEALRLVDEVTRLRALLPSPQTSLVMNDLVDELFVPASDGEARIVGALRAGNWSWRDLVDLIPLDEPTALRTLIALRERGVIVTMSRGTGVLGTPPPVEADLEPLGPSGPRHGLENDDGPDHPSPGRSGSVVAGRSLVGP